MDFSFSQETLEQVDAMIRFAQTELTSDVCGDDHACRFSRENWDRCAEFGVHGLAVPTEYGGGGKDALTTVRLLEALGYGCADTGLTYAIGSQMWSIQAAILKVGNSAQIRKYIPRLIGGQCGAFGITEADSGSDTFSMQTRAEKVDGGYVLNGTKKFVTLAPEAEIAVVFASSDPAVGRWGVSAFIVERGTGGYTTTVTQPKMGLRTTPIGDMFFENCFVPEADRLGPEGAGGSIFTTAMNSERGYIFATHLGVMQRQLEQCIEFARTRQQFQQPIGKFQAVSHRIADMQMRVQLGRLLLYKVAWLEQQGESTLMDASLAKLYLSEAAVASSMDAVRTHGIRGYLSEFEVERDLRDSIGGLIYSGTSDIQRNIIAGLLGL